MFKSILVKVFMLMILVGSSYGLPAEAASLSPFCSSLNGQSVGPAATVASFAGTPFNVGEYITFYATGTATKVDLEIPFGTLVGTALAGGSVSYQIPTPGISVISLVNNTGAGYIEGTVYCGFAPVTPSTGGEALFLPGDSRLNHTTSDRAAPIAVYCSTGDISLIRIDPVSAEGVDEFTVSLTDIDAAGIPSEGALTLAERDWVLLSRLADGRFQVNAHYADGKDYIINWDECDFSTLVHLAR